MTTPENRLEELGIELPAASEPAGAYVNALTVGDLVFNGASELLAEVFGDGAAHTRSAVGVSSLPFGIPVEIEMTVRVAG